MHRGQLICRGDFVMREPIKPELKDQVAIVTGSARGVGKVIALQLAECGAHLVLVGRNAASLEDLANTIEQGGRRAAIIRCDVTKGDEVKQMVANAEAFAGRIDILVNVVGGTRSLAVPIWEISEKDFTDVVALNLTASFLTMAAVLPKMIDQRWGRIINIGGTFGLRGRAERAAYSSAKWGLRGLTKSAALEAGPHNITINCVCPGMIDGAQFDQAGEELQKWFAFWRASVAARSQDRIWPSMGDGLYECAADSKRGTPGPPFRGTRPNWAR
jgi:NAD(P)-dependent dehydrogenase (short-subunit alcohol dehydrogenase family)